MLKLINNLELKIICHSALAQKIVGRKRVYIIHLYSLRVRMLLVVLRSCEPTVTVFLIGCASLLIESTAVKMTIIIKTCYI